MANIERTFSIIKPDAVSRSLVGAILGRIERENFKIVAMKMKQLSLPEVEGCYAVHRERPFFKDLTKFMTEGRIVLMVLEGEDAIRRLRDVMGATDPAKAADGTIRKLYATSIERNAMHG